MTSVLACSSDRSDGHGDEKTSGSLALALQARGSTGAVYRLRNAFFQITDVRSGQTVQFLSSEDGPLDAQELKTRLDRGDYAVTLQPGWFLERLSGSTGGGTAGTGSMMGTGGSGPKLKKVKPPKTPPGDDPGQGSAGAPSMAGSSSGGATSSGGSGPIPGEAGAAPSEGGEGPIPTGGTGMGGSGGTPGGGEFVQAQLISNAVQLVSIFGNDDQFVSYQFKVGGDIIDFNKGNLHVIIGVDDTEACQVPPDVTRPERVLLESNLDAMGVTSLRQVFEALATNGGREADPELIYREIFDSFASPGLSQVPEAAHCGDETTDGVPTLNGFRIDCDRGEAQLVNDLDGFFPTAFVNRIDLAPINGAHCGQQRMIFANRNLGRAFMIVEAQVPNPHPELGIDGCRPLAQFWMDQNDNPDAKARGALLAQAFLSGGVPGLAEAGFGPFYTAENLTVGSGQIRTNQFLSDPWTLREFKLALDGENLRALPFPVAESPNGALWDENSGLAQGQACRESFVNALDGVLTDDLSRMSFVVDAACKDAESRNDLSQNYDAQMSAGLRSAFEQRLAEVGSGLSADDVANRARFSGSCIGCHQESSNAFLGNGQFAPFSEDFPQVTEAPTQCRDGESGFCFRTSTALNTVFLPGRLLALTNLLGVPVVPNPCNGGGGGFGGSSGFGGSFGTAGTFGTAGSVSTGGSFASGGASDGGGPSPFPPLPDEPAPVVEIELPSADAPVEQLQEEDAEIRQEYGDVTISGKSAKSTH